MELFAFDDSCKNILVPRSLSTMQYFKTIESSNVLKPLRCQVVPNLSGGTISLSEQLSFTPSQYMITFSLLSPESNVIDAIISRCFLPILFPIKNIL